VILVTLKPKNGAPTIVLEVTAVGLDPTDGNAIIKGLFQQYQSLANLFSPYIITVKEK